MKSLGIEKIPTDGISDYQDHAHERRFSPYSDNGGSVVAFAGKDFVLCMHSRFYPNWISQGKIGITPKTTIFGLRSV